MAAIPQEFICPISQQIIYDPVILYDGHTFERASIQKWLKTNSTSPITNLPLQNTSLTPNYVLKSLIATFLTQHPEHKHRQFSPLEMYLESADSFFQFVFEKEQNYKMMKTWLQTQVNDDYSKMLSPWLQTLFYLSVHKGVQRSRCFIDSNTLMRIETLIECGANCNQMVLYQEADPIPLLFCSMLLNQYCFAARMIEEWNCDAMAKSCILVCFPHIN